MKHPFHGKRLSEVNTKEVHTLCSTDFISYTNWLMQVRLDYLITEGFIEVVQKGEEDPVFNWMQEDGSWVEFSEIQIENSILTEVLFELGRYV